MLEEGQGGKQRYPGIVVRAVCFLMFKTMIMTVVSSYLAFHVFSRLETKLHLISILIFRSSLELCNDQRDFDDDWSQEGLT
jgi:hypothetical protein